MIHQEKDWVVVNKPAGLSVHNHPGRDLISQLEDEYHRKPHPVHRLDQETSGLMIVAWTPEKALELQSSLSQEQSIKTYVAMVRGIFTQPQGTWDWSLSDKGEGRNSPRGVEKDRKPCHTIWKVISATSYLTQIQCEIKSGRQHQIRKHCALAKHAVLGDKRYGDPKYNQIIAEKYKVSRLFLHAHKLQLSLGHKTYDWTCEVPPEFSPLTRL